AKEIRAPVAVQVGQRSEPIDRVAGVPYGECPWRRLVEVDSRRIGLAENHGAAEQDVAEPVAVDVARGAERSARVRTRRAVRIRDAKALGAEVSRGDFHRVRLAEDDCAVVESDVTAAIAVDVSDRG